ncbi:MAG: aldo/keto reductase family oxidoreductase [Fusicatenibacter sp.]|nr:aldo/keto reductase [Fusicatenibacter sp.]
MRTVPFGSANLQVSAVAVGCMRMNALSESEAERFVKEALDMGVNYFDHADIYGGGSCEELFGKVLQANPGMRSRIFLQSKAGIVPGVMYDNSKEYLLQAVDRILLRLHTDYLDSFLIHRPDALADPLDTAEALDTLVESGKVRYVGVSNQRSGQMKLLSAYMKNRLMVDQLQLSLTNATMIQSGMEANMLTDGAVDRDGQVLDYCRLEKITIQTWSPFQHGFIEGTFLGNPMFPELNQALSELADKYETSNTAIAAAWILNHPAKMQLIAGSMKTERLREICGAADLTLKKEEWYQLYRAAGHMLP